MRIGVMSDSHDRVPAVDALLREMVARGVTMVLHAGDFCAPFALRPFRDQNVAMAGVFGGNDGDRAGLRAFAEQGMGQELFESPHSVTFGEVKVLLVHDLADVQEGSVNAHDVVVYGHTHVVAVEQRGETLLVNPGEACGWLHGTPTAAIIDLDTKAVEVITLDPTEWTR
jgi:putative phosphoesterase